MENRMADKMLKYCVLVIVLAITLGFTNNAYAAKNKKEIQGQLNLAEPGDLPGQTPDTVLYKISDPETGNTYVLVPAKKQQKRVKMINYAFYHLTMAADMHMEIVESITGIKAPGVSGMEFISSYDSINEDMVGSTVIVKGEVYEKDGIEWIEVKNFNVVGANNHLHSGEDV